MILIVAVAWQLNQAESLGHFLLSDYRIELFEVMGVERSNGGVENRRSYNYNRLAAVGRWHGYLHGGRCNKEAYHGNRGGEVSNKVCNFWLAGNCKHGEHYKFLHYNCIGEDVTFLTHLVGHQKVWDLRTFQCIQTLEGHTDVVMSLLCWDQFLLSCSLDNTVKVWVATTSGSLEVTYTHKEEHGVLALSGMHDEQSRPVLLCSCNDYSVHLYDLPSFNERGKIFSRKEVRAFQIGPGGLFFTGDGSGELKIWRWASEALVGQ